MFHSDQVFGNFKIVRKLGEGGMGEVYLAEDKKLNREVALKILLAEFLDNADRRARFIREARTAAKISHPNVMAIYDMDTAVDEESGRELNFIVMENITGVSLTDYLRDKSPGLSTSLRFSEKIAAGLAAAHKLGIVHRDIKCDNIKIDDNGDPKILDFGLAKPTELTMGGSDNDSTNTVSEELTREGKIMGTVTYMAPEQARGEKVDGRADIFSFGVLMYRMFTGSFPFEGSDRVSTLAKILEVKHTPVRQHNEVLPAELERIIDKCLQKDPDDRYQDTRDLVVDLRSLRRQFDSGISDSTTEITATMNRARQSKSFILSGARLAISAVVVAVVAVVLFWYFGGDGDETATPGLQAKENALAILGFENKTGDSELDWLEAGLPEILLTDLAQSGSVSLISCNRILDYLADEIAPDEGAPNHQMCVNAAKSMGAVTVLSGAFYKLGDKIRIDARLEDSETGRVILGEKVVGDDPFALVDSLTGKIAQSLNVREMMGSNVQVADITSSSPEAYKHYILGMEKFNKIDFEEANKEFEKAIEIDSTFALPYMRIGMSYGLQGRAQPAKPYFEIASRFEQKLPLKDRNLLDIYRDLWLNLDYDAGMIKTKSFVTNYPDDKEVRTFYGTMLLNLGRDPQAALAQIDTVLMLDPRYRLALSIKADIHTSQQDYDKVIETIGIIKKYYPNTEGPYERLARVYLQQGRYEEAKAEAEQLLEKFPNNTNALYQLITASIVLRQFDDARRYTNLLKELHGDDLYVMVNHYQRLANVDNWEGKFRSGLDNMHRAIETALSTLDSSLIATTYDAMGSRYYFFDMPDSALYYSKKGYDWAGVMNALDYPLLLVRIYPDRKEEAKPMFRDAVSSFKSRIPQELWPLVEALQTYFEGLAKSDTSLIIQGLQEQIDALGEASSSGNFTIMGRYQIQTGHYNEGIENIKPSIAGEYETSNALTYLQSRYYLGIAYEALGDTEEAIANYREVLKYWGDPDIEIKEIADTRRRLSNLTS